jgi:RNA recognition motif-containing protein
VQQVGTEQPRWEQWWYKVIIRNIPNRTKKEELIALVNSCGLLDQVLGILMPTRKDVRGRLVNRGFAMLCFRTVAECELFARMVSGARMRFAEKRLHTEVTVAL